MFNIIAERLRQKHRTSKYPDVDPVLSDRFRGRPALDADLCSFASCTSESIQEPPCMAVCPTKALFSRPKTPKGTGLGNSDHMQEFGIEPILDLGRCTFCGKCAASCPNGAISFGKDWRMAVRKREDLLLYPVSGGLANNSAQDAYPLAAPLSDDLKSIFGYSLRLRQVSAAGCNACEADINVLGTLVFDMARFGIDLVASPRHADAIIITGTMPKNMQVAAQKAKVALPDPSLVIAVGACAISGGLFRDDLYQDANRKTPIEGLQNSNGASPFMGIDLFIPGCPPHPYTILDGLLRLMGRI